MDTDMIEMIKEALALYGVENQHVETVSCLYHQKKDFISVPYEPRDAGCLK